MDLLPVLLCNTTRRWASTRALYVLTGRHCAGNRVNSGTLLNRRGGAPLSAQSVKRVSQVSHMKELGRMIRTRLTTRGGMNALILQGMEMSGHHPGGEHLDGVGLGRMVIAHTVTKVAQPL